MLCISRFSSLSGAKSHKRDMALLPWRYSPFSRAFFCIQLLSSDIAFACVVRLFLYFLIQSEQVYDFVGGFVQPAAFER